MRHTVLAMAGLAFLCSNIGSATAESIAVNGGFEAPESTTGLFPTIIPEEFEDQWQGDVSAIVWAQNGVTPEEGDSMLQFISTTGSGGYSLADNTASDMWQLIDVSDLASEIGMGTQEVNASARFNRVAGDAETDTEAWLGVWAFSGSVDDFQPMVAAHFKDYITAWKNGTTGSLPSEVTDFFVGMDQVSLSTDADVTTWETLSAGLLLPAATDFLGIRLRFKEDVVNDATSPELDGHYVDNVQVKVELQGVPEPSTVALLGAAGLGMLVYAARRRKRVG